MAKRQLKANVVFLSNLSILKLPKTIKKDLILFS